MRKKFMLSAFTLVFVSMNSFAEASPKLDAFEGFSLGMNIESIKKTAKDCNDPSDSPGFQRSKEFGVSSIFCPAAETFAMATMLDEKLASLAVNWVSWDGLKLDGSDQGLGKIPAEMRKQYGIPNATLPYESQFGNADSDRICLGEAKCQMHIWKSSNPLRVASLVYAKLPNGEVPLLFQLADLKAEQKIDQLKIQVSRDLSKVGDQNR